MKRIPPGYSINRAKLSAAYDQAISQVRGTPQLVEPFRLPDFPPSVLKHLPEKARMAFDNAINSNLTWAAAAPFGAVNAAFAEGMEFLGYPYLSMLAQRPEYRVISETIAGEMTRKWIKFQASGDEESKVERIKQLTDEFTRLKVQDSFRRIAEYDGFMGRSHLYVDLGTDLDGDREELKSSIGNGNDKTTKAKFRKGSLKAFRPVEAVWCYPTNYNSNDPLKADWYRPKHWFVMGREIHITRFLTFVGREVPDLLKPAYSFGGLSMSQIAKPYVDNWLKIRQSVADIVQAFSIVGLKTNLSETLNMAGDLLFKRMQLFNMTRNNKGMFMIDKDTEDFWNIAIPLGGLDSLQAQAQEHMACLAGDSLIETDRGLIPIRDVVISDKVMTRQGWAPLAFAGQTGYATSLIEIKTSNSKLRATGWHPILLPLTNEFVPAENVQVGSILLEAPTWRTSMGRQFFGEADGGVSVNQVITRTAELDFCTELFGKPIVGLFRRALSFTTMMRTVLITSFPTWSPLPALGIINTTCKGEGSALTNTRPFIKRFVPFAGLNTKLLSPVKRFIVVLGATRWLLRDVMEQWSVEAKSRSNVWNVRKSSLHLEEREGFTAEKNAPAKFTTVVSMRNIVTNEPVYNLEVSSGFLPEFYANGILVHNSIARIPLVKLLGIQPSGLNASSEGEVRTFYDSILEYQTSFFKPHLTTVMHFAMLNLWGEVDPEINFEFEPLWSLDEKAQAEVREIEARTGQVLIDDGTIDPAEERRRVASDPDTPYDGLDVNDVPDLKEEEEQGLVPKGGGGGVRAVLGEGEGEGEASESGSAPDLEQHAPEPGGGGMKDLEQDADLGEEVTLEPRDPLEVRRDRADKLGRLVSGKAAQPSPERMERAGKLGELLSKRSPDNPSPQRSERAEKLGHLITGEPTEHPVRTDRIGKLAQLVKDEAAE